MKKTYQGTQDKSKQKFEVIGKREMLVEVPLPMVEVWEELQAQVEQLTGQGGAADHRRDSGKRGDAARGAIAPARGRSRARCVGGVSRVTWCLAGGRWPSSAAGAHAERPGSGTGQLHAPAARRAAAARGAGRHRRGADVAELSPCGAKRGGGVWDRESPA